ncbi:DUF4268 domain-containing protein [Pontibacter sp. G13]|uniref:DUF4268 domain-containing protein n=1 Tax=Pontibacter sp. G13 TaxID=3074898 RepID=UPI002889A560|nr:DUF4268 domain-containing protein [Pontibacter sp. G13]WNJ19917.1 DUF4268 domain-containing protein [Pontibacter sp. G13]
MYHIDPNSNSLTKLHQPTFSELGFREREHLQEWLAGHPEALGEELLIIQKEFDGFDDTRERLDLLALDKQGSLVIIENKLDDSGRDVTWQAMKYASYCAELTKEQIREIYQHYLNKTRQGGSAEENLSEFLNGQDFEELILNPGSTQRIMLVAGKFRKEVTSLVLWLMNFNLRVQCFKATPYRLGEHLFLDMNQILPVPDTEDFMIGMARKSENEISTQETAKRGKQIRYEFWQKFFEVCDSRTTLFQNISASRDNWISSGLGKTGVSLNLVVTKTTCRAELYLSRAKQEENKLIFDELLIHKEDIEGAIGSSLDWERLDTKTASRIRLQLNQVNIFNREDWPSMIEFLIDASERMEPVFRKYVSSIQV